MLISERSFIFGLEVISVGNRKEEILIVALHLFARDGYEAVSVSQIAGELDMIIMKLPEGFHTLIGEGGTTISGGERQRISIARAILKDALIIILDEATANVDPENEKELMEAVEDLTKDKTVIMIAHRLKTVQKAGRMESLGT